MKSVRIMFLAACLFVVSGLNAFALTVTTSDIADGAVTTPKLGSGAVTNAKMSDSAVTTSKIGPYRVRLD